MAQEGGEAVVTTTTTTTTTKGSTTDDGSGDKKDITKGKDLKLALKCTSEFDQICFSQEYKQFLFMASMTAPFFRPENRAAIDLICVVDESGSMEGERIALVKETLQFIIKNLESGDRFGCVGYASTARRVLELTKMDSEGKKKASRAVDGIAATDDTALCAGLLLGLEMMRERTSETTAVSSLMLFTDGQTNVGYTNARDIIQATVDPEFAKKDRGWASTIAGTNLQNENFQYNTPMLSNNNVTKPQSRNFMQKMFSRSSAKQVPVQQMQQQVPQIQQQQIPQQLQQQPGAAVQGEANVLTNEEKEEKAPKEIEGTKKNVDLPCTINTFGFGEGHNESLLQAISEHGRGMYAFIKDAKMISSTFAECLGGLVSVVAQSITLRVETLNEAKINKCLSVGLNLKVLRPNQCYEVTFPDIQSEENRDVVFELSVPSVNEVKLDWPLAQVVCSYKNCILDGKDEQVSTIASVARVESKETGERNYELDLQNNRIVAAEAMSEADTLATSGKLDEARDRLQKAQKQIESSRTNKDKYSAGLVQDIQRCASGLRSEQEYRGGGGKMLKMNYQSHNQQRAVQSSAWASQAQYTTTSKMGMMSKFSKS